MQSSIENFNTKIFNKEHPIYNLLEHPLMKVAEPKLERLFNILKTDKTLIARYLNTYSYMEFIGGMTISRSFISAEVTDMCLHHLLEEHEHARIFRWSAEKVAERTLSYVDQDVLALISARNYIYRIAAFLRKSLKDQPQINRTAIISQYSALILELRTAWLYPKADALLKETDCKVSLAKIIRDENGHIHYLHTELSKIDPHYSQRSLDLLEAESKFYARLVESFTKAARNII